MSPAGWPKGKARGPLSPERAAAVRARFVRRNKIRALRQASLAAGIEIGGHGTQYSEDRAGSISISPAAFRSAHQHVGDCEYVENGVDDCLLHALERGIVYANSVGYQHESPLQELTIKVIAETERHHRKMKAHGPDPRKPSLPLHEKGAMKKLPISARQLEVIGLLAKGLTMPAIAQRLGIQTRTAKSYCDILRSKLEVKTVREIPNAYRERTGKDPFLLAGSTPVPAERAGTPLTAVVEEMFPTPVGKPLLVVVSEMFDS